MPEQEKALLDQPTMASQDVEKDSGLAEKKQVTSTEEEKGGILGLSAKSREEIREVVARATAPGVTRETFAHLDEKKILRKMDLRLLPMLTVLYLLSFIDRSNIGNANVEGLSVDLGLSDTEYGLCLTVFFIVYCAFEVPCNLILKKIRPSVWFTSIMIAWGTVMTLTGIVQDFGGLITARIFLGITESGLFPGVVFYLTMWYVRYEYQWRMALFFSAVGIAGAFSGLLAYGISFMDGTGGLEGWRWIFILEGIATVVVACFAYFGIHDFPETASFLTMEERAFIVWRLKYQGNKTMSDAEQIAQTDEFTWAAVRSAFSDWQVYAGIVMFWGIVCPLYGISLFLPTIIVNLGYETTDAQLLTVPIYVFASALCILVAFYSDRVGRRFPFILPFMVVILIGFIMCISSAEPGVVYAGIFIAAAGVYAAYPGNISWISNNLAGSTKRAAGMALHISCGNLAGAFASNFYRKGDEPRFILGHALEIGFVAFGIGATTLLFFNYRRINNKREKLIAQGERSKYTPADLSAMGDRAITFRYLL